MKNVFVTKTGIKVGVLYEPPKKPLIDDELAIQEALLSHPRRLTLWGRLISKLLKLLPLSVLRERRNKLLKLQLLL